MFVNLIFRSIFVDIHRKISRVCDYTSLSLVVVTVKTTVLMCEDNIVKLLRAQTHVVDQACLRSNSGRLAVEQLPVWLS